MFGKKKANPQSLNFDFDELSTEDDFDRTLPVTHDSTQGLTVTDGFDDVHECLEQPVSESRKPHSETQK